MSLYNTGTKRSVRIPKASELIARKIKHDIVTKVLEEGQLLPTEVKLMDEFGVSRPTIREAYRILEADRLVSVTRGAKGGAVVHRPDPQLITEHILLVLGWEQAKVSDFYEARATIEPGMARAVALKASKTAPAVLQDILDRARLQIKNTEDFAEVLTEFHTALVDLGGNHMLKHVAAAMHEVILRHKALVLTQLRRDQNDTDFFVDAEVGLKSYKKLITLIQQKKADEAEAHWRRHIQKANETWLARFDILIVDLYYELK
jgi:DNA-binding FadR family transcriptional regulator